MPNLIPPKIPDGEKVDFDVSDRLGIKSEGHLFSYRFLPNGVLPRYVGIDMSIHSLLHFLLQFFTLYCHFALVQVSH